VPIVRLVANYDAETAADFVRPGTYVLFDPTNYNLPEAHVEYDADDEDAAFIALHNDQPARTLPPLTEAALERVFDMFEKQRYLHDRRKVPFTVELAADCAEELLADDAAFVALLYPYWLKKRADRSERALLERCVPAPPRDEPSPYIPFRPRERPRPQPVRRDDQASFDRMAALRNDLELVRRMAALVLKREQLRKSRLDLAHEHWQLAQVAAKWHASSAAGLLERRQRARMRDAPSIFGALERMSRGEFLDAGGVLRFTDPDYASDSDDVDDDSGDAGVCDDDADTRSAAAGAPDDIDAAFLRLRRGHSLFGHGIVGGGGSANAGSGDGSRAPEELPEKLFMLRDLPDALPSEARSLLLRDEGVPLAADAPWLEAPAPAPPGFRPWAVQLSDLPLSTHATQLPDAQRLVPWPLEPDRLFDADYHSAGAAGTLSLDERSSDAFFGRPRIARNGRLVFDRVRLLRPPPAATANNSNNNGGSGGGGSAEGDVKADSDVAAQSELFEL
jgi:hypothetical protein